jgi:hypothetical protein
LAEYCRHNNVVRRRQSHAIGGRIDDAGVLRVRVVVAHCRIRHGPLEETFAIGKRIDAPSLEDGDEFLIGRCSVSHVLLPGRSAGELTSIFSMESKHVAGVEHGAIEPGRFVTCRRDKAAGTGSGENARRPHKPHSKQFSFEESRELFAGPLHDHRRW